MPNPRNYSSSSNSSRQHWQPSTGWTTVAVSNATRQARTQSDIRRHKPSGKWVPPTDYVMSEWSESAAYGSFNLRDYAGSTTAKNSGCLLGIVTSPVSQTSVSPSNQISETFDSTIANRALLKLRAKAKDQDINLAQAFAERAQLSNMVVNNANKILNCAVALRRKRWRDALRALGVGGRNKPLARTPSGQFLELKYGWEPLLQDVHGAASALEKRDSEDWKVSVKSKETVMKFVDAIQGLPASANYCLTKHVSKHGSFARVDMVPGNQALITASQLGLTNPAALAWELVPLSFVADWFVPVGEFLDQFDALAGWKILGFSQSNFVKIDWSWSGVSSTGGSGYSKTSYENSWKSRRRFVSLSRSAGTSVPFAIYPRIKNPFSEIHGWETIALLGQALSNL